MSNAGATADRPLPGRPRDERVRQAALAATLKLLAEDGYSALTMAGIAREAGASKQTLYRWWPSKAAITLEAATARASAGVPDEDSGDLETDVRTFIRRLEAGMTPGIRRVLAGMMAESQLDRDFSEQFRAHFIASRRQAFRPVFERAQARGELSGDLDLDLLIDLVFGAHWYRLLNEHAPLDQLFADELTDAVLAVARRRISRPPAP
jgi:AcrR family transcriptional regulator